MEYDEVLETLGKTGRYEKFLIAALIMPVIFNAFNNVGIVFMSGTPEHWCHVPELNNFNLTREQIRLISIPNKSESYESCAMYDRNYSSWTQTDVAAALKYGDPADQNLSTVECTFGWYYDRSKYDSTIVTEWDLVCGYEWLRALAISAFAFGTMIGAVSIGTLSDIFGRKPLFIICVGLRATTSLLLAFAPNFIAFVILRIFTAIFATGVYVVSFVMLVETVAPAWRVHVGLAVNYMWVVSYIVAAGVGYLERDWSKYQWTMSIPSFVFLLYVWFIPESPRWLYTKHQKEKADKIIRKMAKVNKIDLPDKMEIIVRHHARGFVWDTVRTPRMRCRSFKLFFIWAVNSLVYYGLSYNTGSLGGNEYFNGFLAGAVEAPGYLVVHFTLMYFGRRFSLSAPLIVGGLAMIGILFAPPDMTWLVVTLATLGKGSITASYCAVYVITAEIYPTVIRNVGVGAGSFFARIGNMSAPFVAQLGTTNRALPPLLFSSLSFGAAFLSLFLPETKGKHLPETLKDGEEFEKDFDPCGNYCRRLNCRKSGEDGEVKMADLTTAASVPLNGKADANANEDVGDVDAGAGDRLNTTGEDTSPAAC